MKLLTIDSYLAYVNDVTSGIFENRLGLRLWGWVSFNFLIFIFLNSKFNVCYYSTPHSFCFYKKNWKSYTTIFRMADGFFHTEGFYFYFLKTSSHKFGSKENKIKQFSFAFSKGWDTPYTFLHKVDRFIIVMIFISCS